MPTRYQRLRRTIAILAASAAEQAAYLDRGFAALIGGGSAAAYGNDELLLEFDDALTAIDHMRACGELSDDEAAAVRRLDALFDRLADAADDRLWRREALFTDPGWAQARACAAWVLARLPDEMRG